MTGSVGYVNISIGNGTRFYPASGKLNDVFNNKLGSISCQAGGSVVPSVNDRRKLFVQFNDGSGWQSLSPTVISSIPWANYAVKSLYVKFTGVDREIASLKIENQKLKFEND